MQQLSFYTHAHMCTHTAECKTSGSSHSSGCLDALSPCHSLGSRPGGRSLEQAWGLETETLLCCGTVHLVLSTQPNKTVGPSAGLLQSLAFPVLPLQQPEGTATPLATEPHPQEGVSSPTCLSTQTLVHWSSCPCSQPRSAWPCPVHTHPSHRAAGADIRHLCALARVTHCALRERSNLATVSV